MRAALILLLALGCRFGGPTQPAEAIPVVPGDAAADRDASADRPADPLADAAIDVLVVRAPDVGEPDGCVAPSPPAVCDPVCNTGCPALSRCDVAEGTRTGACVGIWITGEGGACFKGSSTDACAARLTCVNGTCRRLCYRDNDCTNGQCCRSPLPSGFMTCIACDSP
jgi:hypothetical protein